MTLHEVMAVMLRITLKVRDFNKIQQNCSPKISFGAMYDL